MTKRQIFLAPWLVASAAVAFAQCPQNDGQIVGSLKTYPLPSDNYAVQYQIGNGPWINATVYISYYGQTSGSPYRNVSGYTAGTTSMSFTSIPALANTSVHLRVTKLFGTPFETTRSSVSTAQHEAGGECNDRQRRYGRDFHVHRGRFRG